jgi:hypothetical protein
MEAAFPVRSVPSLYNEDALPLRESLETAVRRVGRWCEMAGTGESVENYSCEKYETGC